MRVHHHMYDAVNRLLLTAFIEQQQFDDNEIAEHSMLSHDVTYDAYTYACNCTNCVAFINRFKQFLTGVREGSLGKTAQFWMMYCDCVSVLLQFLKAVKENDLELYICSWRQMCPLIFGADRLHYARYLPLYYMQLRDLCASNSRAANLLKKYGIGQGC